MAHTSSKSADQARSAEEVAMRAIARVWGHDADMTWMMLPPDKKALFRDAARAALKALQAAGYMSGPL
jgi:hypothetical protein